MAGLPLLAIENFMKEKGVERVAEDSRDELKKILEEYVYDLAVRASKISQHSGRKTIHPGDLLIANE